MVLTERPVTDNLFPGFRLLDVQTSSARINPDSDAAPAFCIIDESTLNMQLNAERTTRTLRQLKRTAVIRTRKRGMVWGATADLMAYRQKVLAAIERSSGAQRST